MFITLTNKIASVPDHNKVNLNVDSIVYVVTVNNKAHGTCTAIGYGNAGRYFYVSETQDQVMAMINAALRIENERAEHQAKNRLTDMLSKRSA